MLGDQKDAPIIVRCNGEDRIRLPQSMYFREFFSKWRVIVKNDNVDHSTRNCMETVSHGEQRLIPLDAAVSGVKRRKPHGSM